MVLVVFVPKQTNEDIETYSTKKKCIFLLDTFLNKHNFKNNGSE